MSATDPDEPLGGHRFTFSLAPEAAGKANFSVRDNKGTLNFATSNTSPVNPIRLLITPACPFIVRQHGVDPDSKEQLQQPPEEHLPRPRGHLRRRVSHAEQHQHTHHQGVHLRPRGQDEAVQPRGTDGEGGAQHRRPGGHFTLRSHSAQ